MTNPYELNGHRKDVREKAGRERNAVIHDYNKRMLKQSFEDYDKKIDEFTMYYDQLIGKLKIQVGALETKVNELESKVIALSYDLKTEL